MIKVNRKGPLLSIFVYWFRDSSKCEMELLGIYSSLLILPYFWVLVLCGSGAIYLESYPAFIF
jgi:hypothetical protein